MQTCVQVGVQAHVQACAQADAREDIYRCVKMSMRYLYLFSTSCLCSRVSLSPALSFLKAKNSASKHTTHTAHIPPSVHLFLNHLGGMPTTERRRAGSVSRRRCVVRYLQIGGGPLGVCRRHAPRCPPKKKSGARTEHQQDPCPRRPVCSPPFSYIRVGPHRRINLQSLPWRRDARVRRVRLCTQYTRLHPHHRAT